MVVSSFAFSDQIPNNIRLEKDNVDIWCISLMMNESCLGVFYSFLSKPEQTKANQMRFHQVRDRYVASRGILRWVLAAYTESLPDEIAFSYGPHGKPDLTGAYSNSGITFNMSHSNDLALYGVGLGRTLGVDIEKVRGDMSVTNIAKRFFSAQEFQDLEKLPVAQRQEGFFNCWTRKEAYIKARGDSLSSAISRFAVSLWPGQPAALLSHETDPTEISGWSFMDLDLAPGFKAALVAKGPNLSVTWRGNKIIRFDKPVF